MSLFVSTEAAEQLREMDKRPGLVNVGLHDILKKIDTDGIDLSSPNIHKLQGAEEEIYVLKHHSLRLFLTKSDDEIVLMNILKR
ncbi:hypothetical protein GCM10011348_36760 [Marinobacterium nitratireducens]|uniref:Uncharacterized protein n=1 Tax=Marinobacterium nitratireducens TaxID=518897 RepID=A0A917ZMW3_9GAMM|nr:hypothetical protein [Marinobacterium nitratireducens]GGO86276.1 hypothetical protein GCM10011348_36760 [Marinobacterium nitratireducens]